MALVVGFGAAIQVDYEPVLSAGILLLTLIIYMSDRYIQNHSVSDKE